VALADSNHDGKLDIATANAHYNLNLASVANQQRYETQYPPIPGGNLSANLMLNTSGTQIAISQSPNQSAPVADDTAVTLTATISSPLGGPTPTGAVIFEDNSGLVLGTAPSTMTSGTATLTLPNLGSGPHVFTALYSGDTNYQPNTSATNSGYLLIVAGTTVSLSADPSTVPVGSSFTYTVTVGTLGGGADPAGTITLYGILPSGATQAFDAAQTLVGNSDGTSSVSHSVDPGVAAGIYEIYAVYTPAGGSTYSTGSSANEPLDVIAQLLQTSTSLECAPESYFGFPTGNETCYSQVTNFTSEIFQAGIVDFAVNGSTPVTETIQDVDNIYGTPILIGYYAIHTFPTSLGLPYTVTATFVPMPNYPNYASSSASLSF
ncbi:MAG: Ig-like domain-containing protein, partial [Acidobacteriaceae bacterium]